VNACLQLLLALLDYAPLVAAAPKPPEESDAAPEEQGEPQLYAQFNIYRSLLAGITEARDFATIYHGMCSLLSTVPQADGTLLPHSLHHVSCFQEILVLFWKLIDENPSFLQHVLNHSDITQVITPMLYLMWAGRLDMTRVGLIHLCTFILLLLSGDRAFGVGLNKPFLAKLPADLPLFEGSHIDLLIVVIHKLMVDGQGKLSTLYSCFLTIIANASPYAKNLSMLASNKLLSILELFSSPRFLFARPNNYTFVVQLIETFNNIVQYQYESNGVLVYTILRRKDVFQKLADLTVEKWHLVEAAKSVKRQMAQAQAAVSSPNVSIPVGAVDNSPESKSADHVDDSQWVRDNAGPAGAGAFLENVPGSTPGQVAAAPVDGDAWIPTDEWFGPVKKQIPLGTVLRLIAFLQPVIEQHVATMSGSVDDHTVVEFIKATTVVGILPVPHPILVRRYTPNQWTSLWYTTFIYSTIFLHVSRDIPLWDAGAIKLFNITITT
jgi:hypothetical protein